MEQEKRKEAKGLSKEQKAALRDSTKRAEMAKMGVNITDENVRKVEDILKAAKMPVTLKDKDVVMGEREIDIRNLSPQNREQLMFRMFELQNVNLKNAVDSLIDITRLLMLVLKKLGYDDIIKATDDLITELAELSKKKLEENKNKLN